MISHRLSRWTLLCFACALVNFLAAQGLIVAGVSWPAQAPAAPGTLIVVHLLAIGWLLLLMLGALFQFVPVMTSRPLMSQRASLLTLVAVEVGLVGMICGFLAVGGGALGRIHCLPAGGTLVLAGVLVAGWNLGVPLWRARPLSLPGRMVLAGLGFLLLTVTLGLCFALALAVPSLAPPLAPLLGGLADHALAGLGGWLTLTAMGVSYKLLPMFMLAPEERGLPGESVLLLGAGGFLLAIGAGLAQLWLPDAALGIARRLGEGAVALAIGVYLWDVVRLYRTRRRRVLELHNRAAPAAFACLALATALALAGLAGGRPGDHAAVLVLLVMLGWLGGLGLTQLYKIVPFLTWLRRFGSGLGRGPVPRVPDLVNERRAAPCFLLYFAGVLLAALCAWLPAAIAPAAVTAPACRACLGLSLLATVGLSVEYWRAWRARYLDAAGAGALALTPSSFPTIREVDHG